jgi:hypothetical protein
MVAVLFLATVGEHMLLLLHENAAAVLPACIQSLGYAVLYSASKNKEVEKIIHHWHNK